MNYPMHIRNPHNNLCELSYIMLEQIENNVFRMSIVTKKSTYATNVDVKRTQTNKGFELIRSICEKSSDLGQLPK
jgi:hypothetical protein